MNAIPAVVPNAKLAVSASDSAVLPKTTVGVRVQFGGLLVVEMHGVPGESVPIPVNDGEYVVGSLRRVRSSSTASGFVIDYLVEG